MNMIIMGVQGSGKGTQAALLCERFNLKHITTGEIFRHHLKMQTELGKKAQVFIDKGNLVPDELVFEIVASELENSPNGFILDGFPRTVAQAEYLMKQYKIDHVFYLELSDEMAIRRIGSRRVCKVCGANYNIHTLKPKVDGVCDKCGGEVIIRSDDTPEAIAIRIAKFHEETDVLSSYFEELGILTRINANQSIDAVDQEIMKYL
ncbi:MAG TPA: nucleoside monophosphate kinase [Candidatus Cloacimonadota bacterium]|nr:nucleoside monophosphate kinase [Candidatus Cloacimonadota bacterium]HPT72150.1 nucleoside monophosphate kinase [Candidatus Cloacimonadota bacterium]